MSLSLFLARRMYRGRESKTMSRPAVFIAMLGVIIGLAVMIITVSVIVGFKREIRDKIVGFGSHVQITNLYASSYETKPIAVSDSLLHVLTSDAAISHVQRYAVKPGMLKTDDAFQGMILKGVGEDYDLSFFRRHLIAGELPSFSDSITSNEVLISRSLADKLKLKLGDRIDTYFIQTNIRVRRLRIVGIYQTNFSEYDNLFLLTDRNLVNKLNQWEVDQVSGVEIRMKDYSMLESVTFRLGESLDATSDRFGESYCVSNIEQQNPQIFAWLGILDVNIWVILILMLGVAGFTMISGLLIIIIERTSMIGVLKSLGADNDTIRRMFLWLSVFLIGRGMLWGNCIGMLFCVIQKWLGLFRLDPATYYMDTVPVAFDWRYWLLLNIGTLLASVFMLISPSYLITRIHPAQSMRYE